MWPLLLGGTKMKKERKVEALKREIERLKVKNAELESELQNQKEQSQKIIEGLHEQINRYMKADSDKRIRELEDGLRESKERYDAGYKEAMETKRKMDELMKEMLESRQKYEGIMREKIKNVKG